MISALSGLVISALGLVAARLLEAPSWSYAIILIAGITVFVILSIILDKIGAKKMKSNDSQESDQSYLAFVKAVDCTGLTMTGNSLPNGMPLLDATNTTDIKLGDNVQRDLP